MNGTVRLPDCPPRGHERSRVERLLPLTRVTRISYRERTIQQYATMPGRDTAPGFLLRDCAAAAGGNFGETNPRCQSATLGEAASRSKSLFRGRWLRRSIRGRCASCHTPRIGFARAGSRQRTAGTVSSRHLCCSAVRDGPFALPSFIDPAFGAARHASDRQSRVQRLGPSLLRFRDRLAAGWRQGRVGRAQWRRQIHPVQADSGGAHPRRG